MHGGIVPISKHRMGSGTRDVLNIETKNIRSCCLIIIFAVHFQHLRIHNNSFHLGHLHDAFYVWLGFRVLEIMTCELAVGFRSTFDEHNANSENFQTTTNNPQFAKLMIFTVNKQKSTFTDHI